MIQIEQSIEFDKIKEIWMDLALTDRAKEEILNTSPCLSESELQARLRETTEAKQCIEKNGNPPLVSLNGFRE